MDTDDQGQDLVPAMTVAENLVDLQAAVAREQADLGVALDGDGDRIGVVAANGQIIWGDELLVIFAREILARKPGSVIISEVKCSRRLYDEIERLGGHGGTRRADGCHYNRVC